MKLHKNNQNADILKKREIEIATGDLQQIADSPFQVIQYIVKCDTILHPPFHNLKDWSFTLVEVPFDQFI